MSFITCMERFPPQWKRSESSLRSSRAPPHSILTMSIVTSSTMTPFSPRAHSHPFILKGGLRRPPKRIWPNQLCTIFSIGANMTPFDCIKAQNCAHGSRNGRPLYFQEQSTQIDPKKPIPREASTSKKVQCKRPLGNITPVNWTLTVLALKDPGTTDANPKECTSRGIASLRQPQRTWLPLYMLRDWL